MNTISALTAGGEEGMVVVVKLRRAALRRGSVMPTVCMALIVLLGAGALTVDVGMLAVQCQRLQDVADAAALAAVGGAVVGCAADVNVRVDEMVDANGTYPVAISFDPAETVCYGPGDTAPGYGELADDAEAVTCAVRSTVPCCFAGIFGLADKMVVRQATAVREDDVENSAVLFATTANGIKIPGSENVITGLVHSNGIWEVPGSANEFHGPVEYAGSFKDVRSIFTIPPVLSPARPAPAQWSVSDFAPYDYDVSSISVGTNGTVIPPGVYRVHGTVSITASYCTIQDVTFVADGRIAMTGSHNPFSAARKGVYAYSLSTLSNAITYTGSGNSGQGALCAPNGGVAFTGSDTTVLGSTIIAQQITMSGSGCHLGATPGLFFDFGVKLVD